MEITPQPNPIPQDKVRNLLRRLMLEKGIDTQELSKKMKLSVGTVANYLSSVEIKPKTARKFADALNYPYDMLIRGESKISRGSYEELERRLDDLESKVDEILALFSKPIDK